MTDEGMEVNVTLRQEPPLLVRALSVAVLVASLVAMVFGGAVYISAYRLALENSRRVNTVLDKVERELCRQMADDDEREAEDGYACWGQQ